MPCFYLSIHRTVGLTCSVVLSLFTHTECVPSGVAEDLIIEYVVHNNLLNINIETGNTAIDDFFKGNIQLINNFMMALAEEQIKAAFEQAEKEVTDLHSRISQGIRKSKNNGTQIGLSKGTSLTTKKSIHCKAIIQKHSKVFGG